MIPDPLTALRLFLLDDPGVVGEVEDRVYFPELPPTENEHMPRGVIVLSPSGGLQTVGGGYMEAGDFRLDAYCYGTTTNGARAVHRALHPALKQLRREVRAECLVHWAMPAGGPLSLRDPDTSWPYSLSTWQVFASEVAVTA